MNNYYNQNQDNQTPENSQGYQPNPYYNQNQNQNQQSEMHDTGNRNFRSVYNKMDHVASDGIKKKRILAFIIDALFLHLSTFLIIYVFILSKKNDMIAVYEIGGITVLIKEWLGSFVAVILLHMSLLALNQVMLPSYVFHGQSIGKKITKIRMVNAEDESQSMGITKILLRELIGKQISSIFMIGWILFLVSKDGVTIHDKIFKTNVVDDEY